MPPCPRPSCASCAGVAAETHVDWATGVAAAVARAFNFRGQEREDVVSVALLTLCELVIRPAGDGGFDPARVPAGGDPAQAFRGWAYRWVRTACVREAERLRGGGTFNTKRPGKLVVADPLGDSDERVGDGHEATEPRDRTPAELEGPPGPAVPRGRRLAITLGFPRTTPPGPCDE